MGTDPYNRQTTHINGDRPLTPPEIKKKRGLSPQNHNRFSKGDRPLLKIKIKTEYLLKTLYFNNLLNGFATKETAGPIKIDMALAPIKEP